ncbi:hypothetical protein O3P69_014467 [Scylla paramamosain]|uniref:Uncharacterized protein n=1 Tax=Scylla paramamosain TaxID=85552 RepID=A0AAW0TCN0_SCYPA
MSRPPAYPEGKLLGVPIIESSTGTAQVEASMDLLEACELALVFDTTSSNGGVHMGAAKLLEEKLNSKVFYLACRHHILEVLVGALLGKLFGKVKSPENPWFRHFKDVWGKLTTDTPKTLMIKGKWLKEKKRDCEEMFHDILTSEKLPRGDYKEMAELTLEYDEETVAKLERLNIFLALFYTLMWMMSTSAVDAPKVTAKTTLVDLISPESHFLLDILSIGPDWLLDWFESWPEKEDYKKALEHVRNLRVVNDIAEFEVKMMSDFANVITTDPKQKEYLLHAVQYNRWRFKSFKKQTLNK